MTTWKRGTNQGIIYLGCYKSKNKKIISKIKIFIDVYWESKAYHRGGYAYRLCKVNNGKIWEVTEECFQNGHLKFAGSFEILNLGRIIPLPSMYATTINGKIGCIDL